MRYEVIVLARGPDDFSSMTMHLDYPWEMTVDGAAVRGMKPGKRCADGSAGRGCAARALIHRVDAMLRRNAAAWP